MRRVSKEGKNNPGILFQEWHIQDSEVRKNYSVFEKMKEEKQSWRTEIGAGHVYRVRGRSYCRKM